MKHNEPTLTFVQIIAIKGEVSYISSKCKNIEDKYFDSFSLVNLADYAEENYSYYIDIVREYFADEIVNTSLLYKMSQEVPYSIWVNKNKADIASWEGDLNERRSKFVSFIRKISQVNKRASSMILDSIREDTKFDYLKDLIDYFQVGREKTTGEYTYAEGMKIWGITFIQSSVLSAVSELNIPRAGYTRGRAHLRGRYEEPKEYPYKVKKTLKYGGRVVFVKDFESKNSALNYVRMINNTYPEMNDKFDFEIIREESTNDQSN